MLFICKYKSNYNARLPWVSKEWLFHEKIFRLYKITMTSRFLFFLPVDNPLSPFFSFWIDILFNKKTPVSWPSTHPLPVYLWGHLPSLMKMLMGLPLALPSDSLCLWDLILKTNILTLNNSRRKFRKKEEQLICSGPFCSLESAFQHN